MVSNKNSGASKKKSKHPKMHEVVLTLTDSSSIKVLSTRGDKSKFELDVCPKNSMAWNKDKANKAIRRDGNIAKFNKKFGMDFM